ncbi:hypothetical protein ZOSMA_5708G00010 [Zostera marina]|uniref:Uncharacterized protein n=1 Tax=Zostera marina TaxID=29655 RepID=A0A0K9NXU9_ZOSMR|nr:hypothetical protein ZOSMA_5708G00010 [Zostera marina]
MVEIQKLVDENKSDLNSKLHDFEIELSKKRELFDEEQKGKLVSIEEMDSEIKQKEESILKREQALENEIEIFNAGKKERDMKEKELKKLEKDFKTEEIKLQKKTKQYTEDYQRLLILKEEIDVTKKAVETENLRLISQQDSLKLTEKERAEHIDLKNYYQNYNS